MWVYWLLLLFIGVFTVLGFGLLFMRMKEMPKVPVEHSIYSRDFALFLGASALTFVALFVLVGTSSPIITGILKGKASAVDIQYYVKTNLPLGIAITLLTGLGQLLWWKTSTMSTFVRKLVWPVLGAIVITAVVLLLGWEEPLILLFVFTSAFALSANLQVGYEIYMGNPKYSGGAIAHIGLAIMCLGFITSERYDAKKTVALEKGKTKSVLGYDLTYDGYQPVQDGRFGFVVKVVKEGVEREVAPVMYFSEFTKSVMRHPDLINYLDKDFYVAPLSLEEASDGSISSSVQVGKQSNVKVKDIALSFEDFDFSDAQMGAMMGGQEFTIKAILNIEDGSAQSSMTLSMNQGKAGLAFPPQTYTSASGETYILRLEKVSPNSEDSDLSSVTVNVEVPAGINTVPQPETLLIEASVKPFINLVWIGTITLMVGFFITILRRIAQ
jgi:cytochrome c-type biogenesis protein CcmF